MDPHLSVIKYCRTPNKMKFQPRKPNRPRMHFPPDTVEALEPAMYNRVTARNARMEIDFWKQVMMPLKSGLVSEVRTSNPTPERDFSKDG